MRVQGRNFGGGGAVWLAVLLSAVWGAGLASADVSPVALALSGPETYVPGESVEIVVTLTNESAAMITAIGLLGSVPETWAFAGLREISGGLPAVAPAIGSLGRVEFAWINMPTFPYSFGISFNVPEDACEDGVMQAQLETRTAAGREVSAPTAITLRPSVECPPPAGFFERILEWIISFLRGLFGVFFP